MNIAICGLGLIGGSTAKAIKEKTAHTVYGFDISGDTMAKALDTSVLDAPLTDENIGCCDLIIVALYPKDAVAFVGQKAGLIRKGAIITDFCGVKEKVAKELGEIADQSGFIYVGAHPMAGTEKSGFDCSFPELFFNASMILTPREGQEKTVKMLSDLFLSLGFSNIKIATPFEHDKIIAYTSQLAHVLSSAYIKSESALNFRGFSAGSFRDMTRVAWLNETMWTELFLENADFLSEEIDALCERLKGYSQALKNRDEKALFALLKEGRERKEFVGEK